MKIEMQSMAVNLHRRSSGCLRLIAILWAIDESDSRVRGSKDIERFSHSHSSTHPYLWKTEYARHIEQRYSFCSNQQKIGTDFTGTVARVNHPGSIQNAREAGRALQYGGEPRPFLWSSRLRHHVRLVCITLHARSLRRLGRLSLRILHVRVGPGFGGGSGLENDDSGEFDVGRV